MHLTGKLGDPERVDASLSKLARGVVGSEILKIAAQIRALKAQGAEICNLTVGDFDPALFPIPGALLAGVARALADGHTNYPPSDGVLALREAVARFYAREDLVARVRRSAELAVRANRMSLDETRSMLRMYEEGLAGYTYLERA